jgi:hypothetical protein
MLEIQIAEKIADEFPDIKMMVREHQKINLKTLNPVGILVKFPNNYGASIIRTDFSYGKNNELEIAVIKYEPGTKNLMDFTITYETPLTDNVIGRLKEEELIPLLRKIKEL